MARIYSPEGGIGRRGAWQLIKAQLQNVSAGSAAVCVCVLLADDDGLCRKNNKIPQSRTHTQSVWEWKDCPRLRTH